MDGEFLNSPGDKKKGEQEPLPSYTKQFEKVCGYYLSIGMSYEDFWDGEPDKARFYRDKHKRDLERKNQELWLQGIYIYEAILDAAPVLNPLSKKKNPIPYRTEPLPLTGIESKEQKERTNNQKMSNGLMKMREIMANVNKRFENGT